MVNPELIRKRLNRLDEYLAFLERIGNYSYDEFVNDLEKFGAAERFLQLSIETVNDLGSHVVSDLKLGEVNWQSDIPSLVFWEKGVTAFYSLKNTQSWLADRKCLRVVTEIWFSYDTFLKGRFKDSRVGRTIRGHS